MLAKRIAAALVAGVFSSSTLVVHAQAVSQVGQAEVSIKSFKDVASARAAARAAAERDAIASALKLRLNVDPTGPGAAEGIRDLVKTLSPNMRTTFQTEGDTITARTTLNVEGAELTDLSRSLGLQKASIMEAASILFLIDEYWGVATTIDPKQPLVSEVEFFQDRTASASGAAFSDTSSKAAASSSSQSAIAASSKQSSSMAASSSTAVAGSQSSALAASSRSAGAVQDGYGGSAAAARSSNVASAQQSSFAGASKSSVAAANSSDSRLAASQSQQSASASENKNIQASSFANEKRDVTSFRSRTVFPDLSNQKAKPADDASALIAQRLAQIAKQYGLEYTPERDIRETGKGRMLIADIERQKRFDQYTQLAGKNPYNAKYVVFGTSVMNAEGKSASGRAICSGMLKLDSFNVDTGRGLIVGTLAKRAEGSSDPDCRANLSTALATELAEKVGNAATRELQRIARLGQGFTVTLFSAARITRGLGGAFEDALRELAGGDLREDKRTEGSRVYTMNAKGGDLARRIERLLDKLGPEMKNAEVQSKGNRIVVCVEGRCPTDF